MTTRMTAHFSLMTSIQCTIFLPEFNKIYAKKMEMLRIYIYRLYIWKANYTCIYILHKCHSKIVNSK